ncbi:acetyltransferase [Coprinopsis sp. MPI-PUGE-AT-0042]|nr:acetyltransferase [Coprinopsis sp. MPI-PUGE-AT-0042]
MSAPQALERNSKSGELFLRLRKHPNLVLTPPRESDAPKLQEYLSDPRIYEYLVSPPVPYLLEHAEKLLSQVLPNSLASVREVERGLPAVFGFPFIFIRSLQGDEDELIGKIELKPCPEGRYDHIKEEIGSTMGIWTIGDWLSPAFHGQGIMSDAIDTILHDWVIPQTGIKKIVVSAFAGNIPSIRTFEKNGFKTITTVPDRTLEVRGRMMDFQTLVWNAQEDNNI